MVDRDGYHYNFAYTSSKQVLEESKYDGCAVVVYPPAKYLNDKLDKPKARYPSKTLKTESLKKFIYDKSLPLVGLRSYESQERYSNPKLPMLTVFADIDMEKNIKGYQYLANRVRKVAVDYKGKIVFSIADKKDLSYELDDYGLDKLEKKDIGIGLKSGNTYYHTKKAFGTDTIREFVQQYLNGEIIGKEKDINSPPPGSTHDDEEEVSGPSAVVKGTTENFKSEVIDSPADAMVEFYAPW
jgi:protein disulfide-isomerase A3